jgi:NitT/TauT family transport system substrate-binding protein
MTGLAERRHWRTLLLFGITVLLLCCGRGTSKPTRDRVTVAVRPFLSFAPFYLAADEGLFAAQGLTVELVDLDTAGAAAALARGDVDAVSYFLSAGLFTLIERGGAVRIVADKGWNDPAACGANGIIARRALIESGALADVAGLRGRPVDFHSGTVAEFVLDRVLARAGLTVADVSHRVVPQAAKLEALRAGGIEFAVLSEPLISQAEEAGIAELWRSASDVMPGLQWAVLVYGESLLQRRPEVGRRFMIAYLQAVSRYRLGKTDRNVAVIASHTDLSGDLLRRACWPTLRGDGRIDIDSILDFQRWAVERGYLDRVLGPEEFWEPRFVESAAAALVSAEASRP